MLEKKVKDGIAFRRIPTLMTIFAFVAVAIGGFLEIVPTL